METIVDAFLKHGIIGLVAAALLFAVIRLWRTLEDERKAKDVDTKAAEASHRAELREAETSHRKTLERERQERLADAKAFADAQNQLIEKVTEAAGGIERTVELLERRL